MTMQKQARALAKAGRYGDDSIVHMNKREIAALEGIASLAGRRLTKNPKTGATEAFNLFDILPLALNFIAPGMGTAAQIAISAASGAASAGMEGRDPFTGALTGGIISGIAGNLLGGSPGEEAMKAISAGDMSNLSKEALDTVVQGPLGPGVMESALPNKVLPDIFGAGSDAAIDSTISSLLSKQNLPMTLMGASMIAPMLDQPTDSSSVRPDYSPNLRNPGPARQYTPFTGDYSTYGQTGGEAMQVYQPGRLGQSYQYFGDRYEGDPRDYGFRRGGMVNQQPALRNVPPLIIPRTPGQPGMIYSGPSFTDSVQTNNQVQAGQGGKAGDPWVRAMGIPAGGKGNRRIQEVIQQIQPRPPAQQVPYAPNPNIVAGAQAQQPAAAAPPVPATYTPPTIPRMQPQVNPGPGGGYAGGGITSVPGKVDPGITRDAMKSKKKDSGARFIGGDHKGMDDTIPAKIDGKTPAKLSSGEFVIPADVVSMLGDGNTAAGAKALRDMMSRIRSYKTGSAEQADPVNEMDVMPA